MVFSDVDSIVSVKSILDSRWDSYIKTHHVRDVELLEVKKTLDCYSHKNGCFIYRCVDCGKNVFQSLGCNSRICSSCGKRSDYWALNLSRRMFRILDRIHEVHPKVSG